MKTFLAVIGLVHMTLFLLGCLDLLDYKVTVTAASKSQNEKPIPGGKL